jgi:hypothetical protein
MNFINSASFDLKMIEIIAEFSKLIRYLGVSIQVPWCRARRGT